MIDLIKAADELAEVVEQIQSCHKEELDGCSAGCESYSYHKKCEEKLERILTDYRQARIKAALENY